jgi:hypothetical protein
MAPSLPPEHHSLTSGLPPPPGPMQTSQVNLDAVLTWGPHLSVGTLCLLHTICSREDPPPPPPAALTTQTNPYATVRDVTMFVRLFVSTTYIVCL